MLITAGADARSLCLGLDAASPQSTCTRHCLEIPPNARRLSCAIPAQIEPAIEGRIARGSLEPAGQVAEEREAGRAGGKRHLIQKVLLPLVGRLLPAGRY